MLVDPVSPGGCAPSAHPTSTLNDAEYAAMPRSFGQPMQRSRQFFSKNTEMGCWPAAAC
jgi:hypothetical protein